MKYRECNFIFVIVPCTQSIDTKGNMPAQLYGDQMRLKQALINLVKSFLMRSRVNSKIHLTASYNYQKEELRIEIFDLEATRDSNEALCLQIAKLIV